MESKIKEQGIIIFICPIPMKLPIIFVFPSTEWRLQYDTPEKNVTHMEVTLKYPVNNSLGEFGILSRIWQ